MSTTVAPEDLPYYTVQSFGEAEYIVEKSRFIGRALPVTSVEEAMEYIEEVRREHYDARHVCYGLRVGRGAQIIDRSNDDGEPARTAGLPIWQVIEGREATDTLIVVIRYFGGVKLGTGGLARAYREAARQAIDAAGLVQRFPEDHVQLRIPYSAHSQVEHLFADLDGVRTTDTDFAEDITLHLAIRRVDRAEIQERLSALLQRALDDVFEEPTSDNSD